MPLLLCIVSLVASLSVFPADMECRSAVMGLFGKPKRYSLGLSQKDMDALLERVENHFGEGFIEQNPESLSDEQLQKLMNLTGDYLEQRSSAKSLLAKPSGLARNFFESTLPSSIAGFFKETYFIRHLLIPHRTILNRGNIRIVGQWGTPRELAERAMRVIEGLDQEAKTWGLRIPEFTKVLLIDKPFWPRTGSLSSYQPVLDLSRWKAGMSMEFTPFWSKIREDLHPSLIMHERAHIILAENFLWRSSNIHLRIFSEALADFLSSHVRGDPNTYIRNIETMESEGIGIHSIEHLNDDDYSDHAKSLIFSNLLWRLREKIGKEGISQVILPFIVKFNSYEKNLKEIGDIESHYRYFSAVLLKAASEKGYADEAAQAVRESSERLAFDSREVFSHAEEFPDWEDGMWKKEPTKVREAIEAMVFIVGVGFVGGSNIFIFGSFLGFW